MWSRYQLELRRKISEGRSNKAGLGWKKEADGRHGLRSGGRESVAPGPDWRQSEQEAAAWRERPGLHWTLMLNWELRWVSPDPSMPLVPEHRKRAAGPGRRKAEIWGFAQSPSCPSDTWPCAGARKLALPEAAAGQLV